MVEVRDLAVTWSPCFTAREGVETVTHAVGKRLSGFGFGRGSGTGALLEVKGARPPPVCSSKTDPSKSALGHSLITCGLGLG